MGDWACGSCGGTNPEGMRFCGHCGSPRPAATPPVAPPAPPQPPAEERRLVTALFADISGFTALAQRVDTEELQEIVDPIVARLSGIVARHDGYVEKYAGDALLALFGAPTAHDDDAERALDTALEMHRELELIKAELPATAADLTLHVGVNSGHGIARMLGSEARMDYAVLGDAVITAQRLESATPAGETYVGAMTVGLARDRFDLQPIEALTLKGKAEPVPAWRLVGRAKIGGSSTDGHAALARRLVGRSRELAVLRASLQAVHDGRGGTVVLLGEAGAGKSTLVEAIRAEAIAGGIRWLPTRCLSYGAALGYRPIAELLRGWAGVHLEDRPEVAGPQLAASFVDLGLAPSLAALGRVVGLSLTGESGRDGLEDLEPEGLRRALHDAVLGWVSRVAVDGRLAIHIEDLHWGDPSTLALLGELGERVTSELPVLLLATSRDEPGALDGLGAAERTRIDVGPLDAEAIGELATDLLGSPPPDGLAEALRERTAGNPLFVEATVRSLVEGGVLRAGEGGGWRLAAGWDAESVPPTVEGVLAARLDRLPSGDVRILQTGAVIGRRIRRRLLEAVVEASETLDEAVGRLIAGGFLDRLDDGGIELLSFHHALVQDVAYGRMLKRHRRDLHRRVADVAERLYGAGDDTLDLLARHHWLGESGVAAMPYLLRAAERAAAIYANDAAITWYERAESVAVAAGDADRVVAVRLELGDLLDHVGRPDDALTRFRAVADERPEPKAWAGIASVLRKRGEYDAALATVDDGLTALAGSADVDARPLWLERGRVHSVVGRGREAISAFQAGLALGRQDDLTHGRILVQLSRVEAEGDGDAAAALAHADTALGIFTALEARRDAASAERVAGGALESLGRLEEAAARLTRAADLAERIGSAEELVGSLINLGLVESERGRLDAALTAHRRAHAVAGQAGNRNGELFAASNIADVLMRTSDPEALTWARTARGLAEAIGNAPIAADTTETLARIAMADGRFADAVALAEDAADRYRVIDEREMADRTLALAAAARLAAGG